jgi:hypothetical protein
LELTQKLLDAVEADGRIHGSFNPTGTATGRFSSSKPNLQNISRGPVRSCLVATPGCKLVVADYSQIELRAVAAIAGETRMLEAYRNREDLHRKTASIILDKTPEAVTSHDRQLAKPVNFGLIYGQRAMASSDMPRPRTASPFRWSRLKPSVKDFSLNTKAWPGGTKMLGSWPTGMPSKPEPALAGGDGCRNDPGAGNASLNSSIRLFKAAVPTA